MERDASYSSELLRRVVAAGYVAEKRAKGVSMFPAMHGRTLLRVTQCDTQALRRGDVIVFSRSDGSMVAHRIVSVDDNCFTTRGDSNLFVDMPVCQQDIIGKVVAASIFGRFVRCDALPMRCYGCVVLAMSPVSNYICYGMTRVALKVWQCLKPLLKPRK